jgi:hypothetical protein
MSIPLGNVRSPFLRHLLDVVAAHGLRWDAELRQGYMAEQSDKVWQRFTADYRENERAILAQRLLADGLTDVPCAECGQYCMTVDKNRGTAVFECPGCHKRTFAVLGGRPLHRVLGNPPDTADELRQVAQALLPGTRWRAR